MKILYYGGQKSGKSLLAEEMTIKLSKDKKPYYIATYNNIYDDKEMHQRILTHKNQRKDSFITIEEPFDLDSVIKEGNYYLVDCISMWILNSLDRPLDTLLDELDRLLSRDISVVFVLNDVSSGVIPMDRESREYVDRCGIIGQKIASMSDKVYSVTLGIARELK